jgi:class 3 adenylate cyclase
MGDGILAYFGWPTAHEDEAERAIRVGLAIVSSVARLQNVQQLELAARVGIATGLVVVGDLIGEGAAQEEAVVGDTPNLANRLQALACSGEITVSEQTYRLAQDAFLFRDLGNHELKGMGKPTRVFSLSLGSALDTADLKPDPVGGPDRCSAASKNLGCYANSGPKR